MTGSVGICDYFIKNDVSVNHPDSEGRTPLITSAKNNFERISKLLELIRAIQN